MGPLKGLKVVEMSAIGPVPFAGMLLADMGADVVVLDKKNDIWANDNDIMRRGKRSLIIDVKTAEGANTARDLIGAADIVLEGFRPGVMERLGLGPDEFLEVNPRLIYGRMTGWGQTGPLSQAAGHDINYIALTGALHGMGRADTPPAPPLNVVGDYGGGTMFLIMGVLAALYESRSSGKGQVVDAAITEGTANLMTLFYTLTNLGQWSPQRASNLLDGATHYYDTYETSDEKYVSIGSLEPQFYALLQEKMGLDADEFAQQHNPAKWPELKTKIAEIFRQRTQEQWCEILEGTDVCFAPVLDYLDAPNHEHMQARKAYLQIDGEVQPAPAPKFSRTPSEVSGKFVRSPDDESNIRADWGI